MTDGLATEPANSETPRSAHASLLDRGDPEGQPAVPQSTLSDDQATAHHSSRPTRASQRSNMLETAVGLALQGFAVFPLRPGTKTPLVKDWEGQASADPRQIARWWTAHPRANIAIACGPSGLLVVDLDAAKQPGAPRHGDETLIALAAGREIPRTFTVASARGGRHLYFRQPEGAGLRNTCGSDSAGLGPLIDTRGHGGYIVSPGSRYAGGIYRIEHDAPVAPLPTWIASELKARRSAVGSMPTATHSSAPVTDRRHSAYGEAALHRSANTVATAPQGARNHTLNREAFRLGRLVGSGVIGSHDVTATLRRAARKAGLPPGEAGRTIMSGLTAGISHPRSIPDRAITSYPEDPMKETTMATTTKRSAPATDQTIGTPPNAADLYQQLSASGTQAFQNALRTLWRLGPTAIGLPETSAQPVRAAWQKSGKQMADAIQQHEAARPPDTDAVQRPAITGTTPGSGTSMDPQMQTDGQEEPVNNHGADFDFEDRVPWRGVADLSVGVRRGAPGGV